ncbi:hypothetical protein A3E49_03175 [Candidatus Saccharibacteria bacterium RIFCSPHIGHO2_12_FULL_49_19]|nr:MAG: hypothetical protein A2708_02755 [Candidatus Saccharibacteria bacterium RIFCSPHIGHO2_01_FULL_49_21]OGL37075.1 MAG: hypothetical protein A3E49_03175 [Candidatus Saccharibacteria bacterium RIFCSPHIGHO2_12_FULL_49_19]OGL37707.1 MAG: hypothetical protein A3B63_00580 [Candidatus Saccharibacteria bacterium RIFCSPLOWO2_01_FULL_49_22]
MDRGDNLSGWGVFAGFLMLIGGVVQGIAGLTALLKNTYFLVGEESLVVFDYTTWGWLHLGFGLFLLWAGTALLNGANWARVVAIVLASLSVIANLLFIGAYPLWSITVIVLDLLIIYGLTVKGGEAEA